MSKLQIVAVIGYILVLISIPLSVYLVKRTQDLNIKAAGLKTNISSIKPTPITKPKEVSISSQLSELEKLLRGTPTSTSSGTPTPTPTISLAFGPVLNLKVALEGRPQNRQNTKIFVGISTGAITTNPSYILSYTVDTGNDGTFSGISLAGLNPGSSYNAYVKGPAQIDEVSTFSMSPTQTNLNNNQALTLLSGDLNEDNTINSADYTIIKNLYGTTTSSSNWNDRADFNMDGLVNSLDISFVLKNFGKTGASGIWYSTPPATGSGQIKGATGGFWLWIPPVSSAVDKQ